MQHTLNAACTCSNGANGLLRSRQQVGHDAAGDERTIDKVQEVIAEAVGDEPRPAVLLAVCQTAGLG